MVDLLANFNAHYNPAYAPDVTDIDNGITPRSLRQIRYTRARRYRLMLCISAQTLTRNLFINF